MTTTVEETETGKSGGAGPSGADGNRLSGVRQSAADAYEAARERSAAAYASAREAARKAGRRAGDGLDSNPLAVVAGGLALGALLGALLPRSRQEEEWLGPVGRRINDTAREAATAARDAGRRQLDELGLSRDGAKKRLDAFTDQAIGVVKSSAGAAGERVRGRKGK